MSVTELFDKAAAGKRVDRLAIRRPDDFHVHLRDGAMLRAVLPFTAAQFARGIIMPNLVPPVTTVAAAQAYRARILAAGPRFPAADDLLSDRPDFCRRDRKGPRRGRMDRGKTLSRRRHHQFPSWR